MKYFNSKAKLIFLMIFITLSFQNSIIAQIKVIGMDEYNRIKYTDVKNYKKYLYPNSDSTFPAVLFGDYYYLTLYPEDDDCDICYYNSLDSTFTVIKEIKNYWTCGRFIYKNSLYFISTDENRDSLLITRIAKESPFTVIKEYKIKLLDCVRIDKLEPKINIKYNNIKLDSNGNLMLKLRAYKKKLNWFNLIFCWMPRGTGKIIGIDNDTEWKIWYVFDEELNLLYTKDDK